MKYEVNKLYCWNFDQPKLDDSEFIKIIKVSKKYIKYIYPFIKRIDPDEPYIFRSGLEDDKKFIKVKMSTIDYLQRRKF